MTSSSQLSRMPGFPAVSVPKLRRIRCVKDVAASHRQIRHKIAESILIPENMAFCNVATAQPTNARRCFAPRNQVCMTLYGAIPSAAMTERHGLPICCGCVSRKPTRSQVRSAKPLNFAAEVKTTEVRCKRLAFRDRRGGLRSEPLAAASSGYTQVKLREARDAKYGHDVHDLNLVLAILPVVSVGLPAVAQTKSNSFFVKPGNLKR